jgi:cell division transport system permease protein
VNLKTWAARHAQVLVGSLGRLAQQPVASLLTMSVIAVALALPLLMSVLLENARSATANWNQVVEISVYLDKKAAASRTEALAKQLRGRADVAAVRVISAEAAMAQFRLSSGFGAALDTLSDNPLPDTLVVTPTVTASTSQGLDALRAGLTALPDVQSVQGDTEWVKRLHAIMDIVRRVVWLIGAMLSVGVLLVIGNTIRLDILNRRTEIEVMKLVGATNGFARRPFLYSGVWYGLGGGILALLLVALGLALLAAPVGRLALDYGSQFRLRGIGFVASAAILLVAAGLGWAGSWVAASRHIRGIEPT